MIFGAPATVGRTTCPESGSLGSGNKAIIVGMRANPEPHDFVTLSGPKRPPMNTNPYGPDAVGLGNAFEVKAFMKGIGAP